ncbi:helix-turn-helix transcriptional regulator [Pectobacterium aquaticum]|uniref:helix-turn-helix transcriptional regulator n=1 Tax=Pectobacterium aquaticum TaxID=2204145 RepID=UPI000E26B603|nr:WYL domain-containing protein [Pectobacterium aquaticum]UEM40869.1 WYL domain-containing protein [Pectobacterium aquaticum]
MPEQGKRYDRLASRLAILVSRLFMGESLSVKQLALEFNVSERTIQRDLRQRLQYLDTELKDGYLRLSDARGPFRTDHDIITFARITHVAQFFPALDKKLLSVLLDAGQDSPYIVYNAPPRNVPSLFGGFYAITQAIVKNRLINFLHNGRKQISIAPYRLIYFDGEWYLATEKQNHIKVFNLVAITDVAMTISSFSKKEEVRRIFQDKRFITALPHFQYICELIRE